MGDGNDDGKRTFNWMENLSLKTNINPHRLLSIDMHEIAVTSSNNDDGDEIELSLGLSLGGRFGIDKNDKKLIRSSSIAGTTFPIIRDDDDVAEVMAPPRHSPLGRTASLPVETEEWRKRKELQGLRRLAAKRRRSEKQRGSKDGMTAILGLMPPHQQPVFGGGVVVEQFKAVASQGGSSSGGSESAQGSSSYSGASPASIQSRQDRSNHEVAGSSGTKGKEKACKSSPEERENPLKRPENFEKCGKETGLSALEDMPCVFTQGDGPNGRRIEGILYRYGKGEEVSIMCVCHGRFLSPAEFVEHAGITDVVHPLKHIVVNPSSNSYL